MVPSLAPKAGTSNRRLAGACAKQPRPLQACTGQNQIINKSDADTWWEPYLTRTSSRLASAKLPVSAKPFMHARHLHAPRTQPGQRPSQAPHPTSPCAMTLPPSSRRALKLVMALRPSPAALSQAAAATGSASLGPYTSSSAPAAAGGKGGSGVTEGGPRLPPPPPREPGPEECCQVCGGDGALDWLVVEDHLRLV